MGPSLAIVLLLAALPGPVGEPLAGYTEARAMRSWGAHLHCSAPGHDRILRAADRRFDRIRGALIRSFGTEAVAAAEARARTRFEEDFASVGPGIACRRDRFYVRRYNDGLSRDYDTALRPLEIALGLRRR